MNLPRLDHQVHGMADDLWIDGAAGAVERGDGAAENLAGVSLRTIVGFDCTADVSRTTGQTLRQLKFERRVTGDAERTAKPVYRRLADLGCLSERGNAVASGLLRIAQDHF